MCTCPRALHVHVETNPTPPDEPPVGAERVGRTAVRGSYANRIGHTGDGPGCVEIDRVLTGGADHLRAVVSGAANGAIVKAHAGVAFARCDLDDSCEGWVRDRPKIGVPRSHSTIN